MAYVIEMFPEERILLEQELRYPEHAELWERLANHSAAEFEIRLAEIASYCEVILDGTYSVEEINKLCAILTKRLKESRTGFILPPVQ